MSHTGDLFIASPCDKLEFDKIILFFRNNLLLDINKIPWNMFGT